MTNAVLSEGPAKLIDESSLADAGIADNGNRMPVSRERLREAFVKQAHFPLSANQRCERAQKATRNASARRVQPLHAHGIFAPADGNR